MYQETNLDVDLYTSRVWWTLAALKLFRRDLLEANGIRFPEHYPNCSDQPFTGTAYLRARKISVLSDYDYYYVVARDDGKHVTSSGSVSNRIDVFEAMCELVEREVPDPVKRAPLLTRHFQIDLRTVMHALARSPRSDQEPLFERVVALIRTHLTPEVARRLGNNMQVIYHLAGREMLDETLVAIAFPWNDSTYDITAEGDRVFAHLPFFRDPAVGVPDEYYDVTHRTHVDHALTSYSWTGTTLHITGTAGLRHVTPTMDDTVEIVVRKRQDTEEEYVVRATRLPDNAFEATVDLLSIDGGGALTNGFHDLYLRIDRAGYSPHPSLRWTGAARGPADGSVAPLRRRRRPTVDRYVVLHRPREPQPRCRAAQVQARSVDQGLGCLLGGHRPRRRRGAGPRGRRSTGDCPDRRR